MMLFERNFGGKNQTKRFPVGNGLKIFIILRPLPFVLPFMAGAETAPLQGICLFL